MSTATPTPIHSSDASLANAGSRYNLDETERTFLKARTGIQTDEELKQHILAVQREALTVHPYPCIVIFSFTKLNLGGLPAYGRLLELGKTRKDAIWLDVGCCFGNDVRKAVDDGYPIQNIIATDINPEFWVLGHKLFASTPETFPVPFVPGDAFDPAFLAPAPIATAASAPTGPAPPLSALTTLTPLHGRVSAVSVCNVFHLFAAEEEQARLARALAPLLSAEPGSMLLGKQAAQRESGVNTQGGAAGQEVTMFFHNAESWTALWDGGVFAKGTVEVEAQLVEPPVWHQAEKSRAVYCVMEWSVTRV
ncbi:uncharacterized protein BXZ73DRAFT_49409 [Epithele typhae]|uniref:uncharacterized protein n=1 Tax=Epithele typhae TaxID=378194 RepID=UPI0020089BC5|nr:uncharacterized protein BXZ73DRAFT_49409 [Epithele typhae]KAH9926329.1 hypothetical protein BXZ73DRAFT_49409 [Epithele typhae]